MDIAVVGATGMVGQEMLRVLEGSRLPLTRLVPLASERSAGKRVALRGRDYQVQVLEEGAFEGVGLALFSAGGDISRIWCPRAASAGALVIDNSSAWRMDSEVPLCVPEVNLDAARTRPRGIIANPNCSTIQLVVALAPIHRKSPIERLVISTYQAVSGAGARAAAELTSQTDALAAGKPVPTGCLGARLAGNLLMEWKVDAETGYQEEELKLVRETHKILGDASIRISPTTVRVPVTTAHAESVTLACKAPLSPSEVRALLEAAPGVRVVDDFASGLYPTPLAAAGGDEVLVGRIRQDVGHPGGIQLWIVADNLRKGAALNAVQIAEALL